MATPTTPAAAPPTAAPMPPTRRTTELLLVVGAVLIAVFGYVEVGVNIDGRPPPDAATYGAGGDSADIGPDEPAARERIREIRQDPRFRVE